MVSVISLQAVGCRLISLQAVGCRLISLQAVGCRLIIDDTLIIDNRGQGSTAVLIAILHRQQLGLLLAVGC